MLAEPVFDVPLFGTMAHSFVLAHGSEMHAFEQFAQTQPDNVVLLIDTSADGSYLDCAYKLQEYAGRARRKRSEGKATWPGRKQVWRRHDEAGVMAGDVVTVEHDAQQDEALIQPVAQLCSITPTPKWN